MENLRKRHHTDGGLDVCMVRFSSKGPGPFPRAPCPDPGRIGPRADL